MRVIHTDNAVPSAYNEHAENTERCFGIELEMEPSANN
jgi:hypothetical protein